MSPARQILSVALALLLAAVAQGRFAHSLAVHGAQPDFLLVTLACGATLVGASGGIGLGVWAGLLTAALVPMTPGTFLISRLLAGAFAGSLQGTVIQRSVLVPPLVALTTTLAAEIVYVLMAPTHHLRAWGFAIGGEAIYNMLWALPISAVLRRAGVGRNPDDSFSMYS